MGMCVGVYLYTVPLISEYNSLPPDSESTATRRGKLLEIPRVPAAPSLEADRLITAKSVGVERHTEGYLCGGIPRHDYL
jgi:hypothetical protein